MCYVLLIYIQVSEWYDVVIFTASLRQYADPVIDQLDKQNIATKRLFREVRQECVAATYITIQSCLNLGGNFIKDFEKLGWDLASTIIIDNSPIAYSNNKGILFAPSC